MMILLLILFGLSALVFTSVVCYSSYRIEKENLNIVKSAPVLKSVFNIHHC